MSNELNEIEFNWSEVQLSVIKTQSKKRIHTLWKISKQCSTLTKMLIEHERNMTNRPAVWVISTFKDQNWIVLSGAKARTVHHCWRFDFDWYSGAARSDRQLYRRKFAFDEGTTPKCNFENIAVERSERSTRDTGAVETLFELLNVQI